MDKKRYTVHGTLMLRFSVEVKADSEDEAEELVAQDMPISEIVDNEIDCDIEIESVDAE